MQDTDGINHPGLGIHLNWQVWSMTRNWPDWTNGDQRKKWEQKGLILWDEAARQVTRLSGQQAVSILDHLRHVAEWKEEGYVVGEPVWRLPISNPERQAEIVLADAINLSPQQTQVLFDFLVREEERLQEMKAAEEAESNRILDRASALFIKAATYSAERGKHTIFNETLSWEENKRIMRQRWESRQFPEKLTWTEQKLVSEVLDEMNAEYEREKRRAQERELRMKKNLLTHHFFWERVKPLWLYLKASERLHILHRLQDTEWSQDSLTAIKEIIQNAQFFDKMAAKSGSKQDVNKMSGEELDLLLQLNDTNLWHELLGLYKQKPTADSNE